MDALLIVFGIVFSLAGIIGCVLPVVPGPPLNFIGLLLLHFTQQVQFSTRFLVIWGIITAIVYALDLAIPVWGTKKLGGSKTGIWGSLIGLVVGMFFFPPAGIIIGPFVGAVIGELLSGKTAGPALKSGFGSFLGFVAGTLLKLITSAMMTWYFFKALIAGV